MALLTVDKRKEYFKDLGLGEYSKENILKLQKKYFIMEKDRDGKYGSDTDNLLRHIWNVKHYTENFSPEEFRCECGGRYCTGYPTYMKPHQLMHLQKIRNIYAKPMIITCGMRCRGYNAKLNGSVANSKHLTGRAADFYMRGVTETLPQRKKAVRVIKKLANHTYTYGDGINSYGGYVSAPYMGNALHTDTK